jgi:hypothetical protein
MHRVRVRRGTWDILLPSRTDVRSDLLDASSDFPLGSTTLDHTMVARRIPYRWYALEDERPNGEWHPSRLTI